MELLISITILRTHSSVQPLLLTYTSTCVNQRFAITFQTITSAIDLCTYIAFVFVNFLYIIRNHFLHIYYHVDALIKLFRTLSKN